MSYRIENNRELSLHFSKEIDPDFVHTLKLSIIEFLSLNNDGEGITKDMSFARENLCYILYALEGDSPSEDLHQLEHVKSELEESQNINVDALRELRKAKEECEKLKEQAQELRSQHERHMKEKNSLIDNCFETIKMLQELPQKGGRELTDKDVADITAKYNLADYKSFGGNVGVG